MKRALALALLALPANAFIASCVVKTTTAFTGTTTLTATVGNTGALTSCVSVPFTNAAGGDYSLNNTAGQGAACRSVGFSGTAPFGTGYNDIGPLRHQDPTGGGFNIVFDD